MNTQDSYSDEHISAYIDGELDKEERARLLFSEQEDEALARCINEARIMKEKGVYISLYPHILSCGQGRMSEQGTTEDIHSRISVN